MDSKLNATHNTAHRIVPHLLEAGRLSLRAEPGGLSLMPLVLLAEEAEPDAPRAAVVAAGMLLKSRPKPARAAALTSQIACG